MEPFRAVPPKIEHKGQLQLKVVVGSSIGLPCNASGFPKPRILWQKGTRVLSDVPGKRISTEVNLRETGFFLVFFWVAFM